MNNANNNKTVKQNNTGAFFEVLEQRTLMSAAPMMTVAVTHQIAAIVHQPILHTVAKKAKVTRATKAQAVKTIKASAPLVEPAVTNSSIKYQDFSSKPLFATNGPSINDINQGYVGDCFFLSTLSAIAKTDPKLIRNDIATNTDGTYSVKLFSNGKAQTVKVDAELPVWPGGQLAYAGLGTQGSIWVAILEKAYAEIRTTVSSYASIDGGWMTDAFSAMGVKSTTTFTQNATTLLKTVQSNLKAHQAVTVGINYVPTGAPLIADHAYEVDSVNTDKTGKVISIRLRNPWGVDGAGNDGNNDGYVTVTASQLMNAFDGVVSAKA